MLVEVPRSDPIVLPGRESGFRAAPGGRRAEQWRPRGAVRRPSAWTHWVLTARLSGPLAFSDSRILLFGLGPETFKIRLRKAGFQPPWPGETFVFLYR